MAPKLWVVWPSHNNLSPRGYLQNIYFSFVCIFWNSFSFYPKSDFWPVYFYGSARRDVIILGGLRGLTPLRKLLGFFWVVKCLRWVLPAQQPAVKHKAGFSVQTCSSNSAQMKPTAEPRLRSSSCSRLVGCVCPALLWSPQLFGLSQSTPVWRKGIGFSL